MCRSALMALIPLTMIGCGGGLERFTTAKVDGKVLCNGQPVANVALVFAPVARKGNKDSGKAGFGSADASGAFTVSTYGKDDGAVVGKHTVIVMPPPPEDVPKFRCPCETNPKKAVQEVEVVAGQTNNFLINLPLKVEVAKPATTKVGELHRAAEAQDALDSAAASEPAAGKD
ncbi:MAG: hypothetical protein NTZ32_17200 [Planctomycetales bacterium]|nr:hypothetical protein [Planctomycetales bacterium]